MQSKLKYSSTHIWGVKVTKNNCICTIELIITFMLMCLISWCAPPPSSSGLLAGFPEPSQGFFAIASRKNAQRNHPVSHTWHTFEKPNRFQHAHFHGWSPLFFFVKVHEDLAVDWISNTAVTAGWDANLIVWCLGLEKNKGTFWKKNMRRLTFVDDLYFFLNVCLMIFLNPMLGICLLLTWCFFFYSPRI